MMRTHSTQILVSKHHSVQRNRVSVGSVAAMGGIHDKAEILLYQKTSIHNDKEKRPREEGNAPLSTECQMLSIRGMMDQESHHFAIIVITDSDKNISEP